MSLVIKAACVAVSLVAAGTTASAQNYQPVTDRDTFLQLLGDNNLSNRLYAVNLRVSPDGTIDGTGAGWDITGTWYWENGFFCREMEWGGDPIAYNCQLVETNGPEMRFTTDQGTGDSASFRLR